MCSIGEPETIERLFFDCPFAQHCWSRIQITWDVSLPLMGRCMQARSTHAIPFFTEADLIAAWELWKLQNDKVFQRRDPTPAVWFSLFKSHCFLQSVRFKDDLRHLFIFGLMLSVNPCMYEPLLLF
jgi:hypothetical protein